MFKSGLKASGLLAIAVLSASSALAIDQNDGAVCGAITPDPNGGCNVTPNAFQSVGSVGVGNTLSITGTMGTYIPAGGTTFTSRDLDWYSFTLTEEAKVTVTLNRDDGGEVVLFLGSGNTCPFTATYGQAQASFTPVDFFLPAGTYTVIATTNFEVDAANPLNDCIGYQLTVDVQDGDSACGTGSTQPCDVAHAQPGCDDWNCCNLVCISDPNCCSQDWDALCVTNGAVGICGYFIYSCNDTNPANDCLTSAGSLALNTLVPFDLFAANTDGPSALITGAASGSIKDVWYFTQAPGNGQLNYTVNTPSFDSVLELYGPFDTASVGDPEETMLPAYIGTIDGFGAGGEGVTLLDAQSGKYYLIRIAQWDQDTVAAGAGDVTATFNQVIYTTGVQKFIVQGATNTNLGLSSGALSAAQPRRWLARPFIAPTPSSGNAWDVTQIIAKGFVPAGAVNENLNWIIWNSTTADFSVAPVAADQVVAGSVVFPTPFDDALDSAATASHPIVIDPPVTIPAGNYYLTVYGQSAGDFAGGGTVPSNFAWFIYSPDGFSQVDGAGAAYSWRSANFPTPGFVKYTGLVPANAVQAGDDPLDLYNNAFTILGEPTTVGTPCPADLDGNGSVNAADLAVLLGAWGGGAGPADLDGNGTVNAADLAVLLGGWGNCP